MDDANFVPMLKELHQMLQWHSQAEEANEYAIIEKELPPDFINYLNDTIENMKTKMPKQSPASPSPSLSRSSSQQQSAQKTSLDSLYAQVTVLLEKVRDMRKEFRDQPSFWTNPLARSNGRIILRHDHDRFKDTIKGMLKKGKSIPNLEDIKNQLIREIAIHDVIERETVHRLFSALECGRCGVACEKRILAGEVTAGQRIFEVNSIIHLMKRLMLN